MAIDTVLSSEHKKVIFFSERVTLMAPFNFLELTENHSLML